MSNLFGVSANGFMPGGSSFMPLTDPNRYWLSDPDVLYRQNVEIIQRLDALERRQIIILQELDLLIRQSTVQSTRVQQWYPHSERRRATASKVTVVPPGERPEKIETEQGVKLPVRPALLSVPFAIDSSTAQPSYLTGKQNCGPSSFGETASGDSKGPRPISPIEPEPHDSIPPAALQSNWQISTTLRSFIHAKVKKGPAGGNGDTPEVPLPTHPGVPKPAQLEAPNPTQPTLPQSFKVNASYFHRVAQWTQSVDFELRLTWNTGFEVWVTLRQHSLKDPVIDVPASQIEILGPMHGYRRYRIMASKSDKTPQTDTNWKVSFSQKSECEMFENVVRQVAKGAAAVQRTERDANRLSEGTPGVLVDLS